MSEKPPRELHTEADDIPPLSPKEAESMGRQTETYTRDEPVSEQVVYGDVEDSPENEDQTDAHHAGPDEHV